MREFLNAMVILRKIQRLCVLSDFNIMLILYTRKLHAVRSYICIYYELRLQTV